MKTERFRLLVASAVLALSACGGGGATPSTPDVTLPPPPLPMGDAAAARLLSQATFGTTLDSLTATSVLPYDAWFVTQAALPASLVLPSTTTKDVNWMPFWLRNVVMGQDQLRQRMAFALSEILVVSGSSGGLQHHNQAQAYYYDLLVGEALGNYRTLLEKVTLSPAMGVYLSMFRNNKPDAASGVHADENYAREVMQLFSIGLVQLNADGTPKADGSGKAVPTYTQADVEGLARVFTGWASAPVDNAGEYAWLYDQDFMHQMVAYEAHHDTDAKTLVGGVYVPAGGSAAADLKIALDTLFNHPNVGPFIGRQLIQRLVTSNPSPAYVKRVAAVFANNGRGVRGDLLAVAQAIVTDPEATRAGGNLDGKLREPLLQLTHLWRAFSARDLSGAASLSEYAVTNEATQQFGQAPLQAPSVFNFFRPDYRRAGPIADAGIVAPELQIQNESSLVVLANRLQSLSYQYIDALGVRHSGADGYTTPVNDSSVMLRTGQWELLAVDATLLVTQLDRVLMSGLMPAAMRDTLVAYATAIPPTEPARRVVETAELIINSPQYAVQR